MTRGERIAAALFVGAVHLSLFAPTIGDPSPILLGDFAPQAEAIERGDDPYADQELEYPPLSLVVLQAPGLLGEGIHSYVVTFQWEMLLFDLAIVALLALALPSRPERVIAALFAYTLGLLFLSGELLGHSRIDVAPLWLARFDLVPAFLVLAAVLAREAERSATWSSLLAAGAAVKAFPLALYPAMLRGELSPRRVIYGAVAILVCSVGILVAIGDRPASALSYHSERELQIEAVFATPFEVASLFGAEASSVSRANALDLDAAGAGAARWATVAVGLACYLLVLGAGWRARVSHLRLTTALLAVIVVLPPVLSPQFLLWLLPLSAAAYGFGRENALLLAALILTQLELQYFPLSEGFEADWVWRIAARNAALLAYLWVVCAPIVRAARYAASGAPPEAPADEAGTPQLAGGG